MTNVGISTAFDKVTFTYEYTGRITQKGTLLFVSSDGEKQYGYKVVEGREASHFIFNLSSAQQKNVALPATVAPGKALVSFAASDVNLPGLVGGTATVNVDGVDVDACTLTLD